MAKVLILTATMFSLLAACTFPHDYKVHSVLVGTGCGPDNFIVVSTQDEDGDDFVNCSRIERHEYAD